MEDYGVRQIIELEDKWLLPLQGQAVIRSYTFPGLVFDLKGEERSYHIRMGGDAIFQTADGDVHRVTGERWVEEKPELVALFRGKVVEQGFAYKDGRLELNFEEGSVLEIHPDSDYESWGLVGTGDLRVIGLPGGDLAIWYAKNPVPEALSPEDAARTARKLERPVDLDNLWFLPLRKRTLTRCLVDQTSFALQFEEEGQVGFTLRIEGPFLLVDQEGRRHYLVPPEGVTPALELPGQVVSKALAYKDGRLRVLFKGGYKLFVDVDEGQVWELTGSNEREETLRMLSRPGLEPRVQVDESF